MDSIGLKDLLQPVTVEHFLDTSWPYEPFVIHGSLERLQTIAQLPFLQSLDALLTSWPATVQAHLPDVSDESSSVEVNPENAKKLYENKMALLFNNVQNISPTLATSLSNLHRDLGLPQSTFKRCMIYATPNGKGTAAHFDQNVNFVLQTRGTKKWKLAPNFHVENPTERYTIGQPLDPELASYSPLEMPTEMPDEHENFVLEPGSLLFVPRGYWHSTEAEGEALALNFTFSQPTWTDLFTLALRSRLLLSPEWRELADGVGSSHSSRRHQAHAKFEGLLLELIDDLPHWRASDILNATEGFDFESLDSN